MLVQELRIYWGYRSLHFANARLVKICPHLRHVDLQGRGIDPPEAESLSRALAQKSFVTICIVLKDYLRPPPFPILDLMQRWPGIRKISITSTRLIGQADLQASEAINCCPELRELSLVSQSLREGNITSLRLTCSTVTHLEIGYVPSDAEALDELCRSLHAWSPTLECLRLYFHPMTPYYPPFSVTLSSLTNLETLFILDFHLDVDAISSLPHLKHLRTHYALRTESVVDRLACLLEDSNRFVALTEISCAGEQRIGSVELRDVCHRRNIELQI